MPSSSTGSVWPRDAESWGGFSFGVFEAVLVAGAAIVLTRRWFQRQRAAAEAQAIARGTDVDGGWRYRSAARVSWLLPLVAIAFSACTASSPAITKLPLALVGSLLLLAGVPLGMYALLGVQEHGSRRILAPAAIGILIPLLLLALAVWQFMTPESPIPSRPG
jgi:hypothetical protein